jgi:hypothetical protein
VTTAYSSGTDKPPTGGDEVFTQDLATKVLLVIAAALGFAFGLLLDRVKADKERKRSSWDKNYAAGMVAIRSDSERVARTWDRPQWRCGRAVPQ